MDENLPIYVHSLSFRCGQCAEPIVISVTSPERNLEGIDGNPFDVKCECGWSKRFLGLEAVARSVIPLGEFENLEHLRERSVEHTRPTGR